MKTEKRVPLVFGSCVDLDARGPSGDKNTMNPLPEKLKKIKPMTVPERGVWFDAEGTLQSRQPPNSSFGISTYQEYLEPLVAYRIGVERDGIPCKISSRVRPPHPPIHEEPWTEYSTLISGAANVAKETKLIQDYVRNPKKLAQIDRFRQILIQPRVKLDIRIIKARQILGLSSSEKTRTKFER